VDWATASALGTSAGTLVLAAATFASVRSGNRSARVAERALMAGQRPLIVPSRLEDPLVKVGFIDDKWLLVPGGQAAAEATAEAVYLAISVRNVGTGIAVLHGWRFSAERAAEGGMPDVDRFTRLTRDIYISPGDTGFWQGTFRDPASPGFAEAVSAIEARTGRMTVEILYADFEGGQRMVSLFLMIPHQDDGWLATVARHWSIDGPGPRQAQTSS
jgi:hypothetical protein